MFNKCKHDWEVKVDRFVPALMEKLVDSTKSMKNVPPEIFVSTHIVIMTCKKCGKIDKTITEM